SLSLCLTSYFAPLPGVRNHHEENLSTEQAAPQAHARVPRADGDACRPCSAEAPACEGPRAPDAVLRTAVSYLLDSWSTRDRAFRRNVACAPRRSSAASSPIRYDLPIASSRSSRSP